MRIGIDRWSEARSDVDARYRNDDDYDEKWLGFGEVEFDVSREWVEPDFFF